MVFRPAIAITVLYNNIVMCNVYTELLLLDVNDNIYVCTTVVILTFTYSRLSMFAKTLK